MSELQIVLIGIGALIILAVLVINWWQEKKFHRQVENSFSPLEKDALLDDPTFNHDNFTFNKIDNRATDHFTINDLTTVNNLQKTTQISQGSNRFVKLAPDNVSETQEIESIDTTYNEIINSKLDKQIPIVEDVDTSYREIATDENHNQLTSNFKSVFDEALSPSQENNESTINKEQDMLTDVTVSLPSMLNPQIDLIALLYLATETPINIINNALTSLFDNFDKPIFVHVLDSDKKWHLLKDLQLNQEDFDIKISRIACSMQLADRGGAVARSSLNRFQLAVETLGLDVNGHVEWQDTGDTLAAANALDSFCLEVDKTIGFHLMHGDSGAFTGTKLRGLAEAQGLLLSSDGYFKYFDQSLDEKKLPLKSQPLFVMFNRDDNPFSPDMLRSSVVKGITFQLDIPHVKQSAEVFTHMIQVARQMEIGLNATLVDDNNKPLGDIQVEKIRQQLKKIQATMLVRGIVPGSDNSHRLFS